MDGLTRGDRSFAGLHGSPFAHHTGTTLPADAPSPAVSELVRDLGRQTSPAEAVTDVLARALEVVPGAAHASASLVQRRRRTTTTTATSAVGRRFEEVQRTLGEGPSLDALAAHETVRVDDLSTERRWPLLAGRWREAGVRSALVLQLFVPGHDLGVLTLLAEPVGAFDDDSERWGRLLASYGAVAVAVAVQVEGLQVANTNRTVIGQAEGILMERLKIDADTAFALLAKISQDSNRKLFAVAEDVVQTGEVPGGRRHSRVPRDAGPARVRDHTSG